MEVIDGGDVREDFCGDFWRDFRFRQSGVENLGIEKFIYGYGVWVMGDGYDGVFVVSVGVEERFLYFLFFQ